MPVLPTGRRADELSPLTIRHALTRLCTFFLDVTGTRVDDRCYVPARRIPAAMLFRHLRWNDTAGGRKMRRASVPLGLPTFDRGDFDAHP